jgi:hypothetical protein
VSKSAVTADHANPPLVRALSIGTSSVRALLFDRLGRAIEGMRARRACRLDTAIEGAAVDDVTDSPSFIGEPSVPHDGRHARYRKAVNHQQMLYEILVDRQNADSL